MGWKSPAHAFADMAARAPRSSFPAEAPSGSLPCRRRTAFRPAMNPGGSRFHIPLHPRHLPGKKEVRACCLHAEISVQHLGGIEKRVAVHHAVAGKLRHSARPGIMPNTRFCSPNFRFVWNPTRLYSVPFRGFRGAAAPRPTACRPVAGSRRPTGFIGPYRMVSMPALRQHFNGHTALIHLRVRAHRSRGGAPAPR